MLKAARAEIADAAKAGEANASTAHHYASALHVHVYIVLIHSSHSPHHIPHSPHSPHSPQSPHPLIACHPHTQTGVPRTWQCNAARRS